MWGGVADLDVMNYVVVFEAVDADGEGTLSDPTTLLELGLDPALIGMDGDGPRGGSRRRLAACRRSPADGGGGPPP